MTGTKILKILFPFIFLLILLVSSCRTLPEGPYPDIVDWLPMESDIFFRMEIPGNEELIDLLLTNAGLDPDKLSNVLERTALVAVGLELDETRDQNPFDVLPIHLASIGVWSKNLLGTALGRDWKKSGLGRHRWTGPGNLELTALSNSEIILSHGKIDVMLERLESGDRNPRIQRAYDLKNGADLAVWVTEPDFILRAVPILPAANPDGTPVIDMIGLALRKVDEHKYALFLRIYPTDSRLSGSLSFALRLGLSARFGLSPDPDERALLSGLVVEVGTGEVTLMLPSLSVDMLDGFLKELNILQVVEQ